MKQTNMTISEVARQAMLEMIFQDYKVIILIVNVDKRNDVFKK